ncbi:MAG: hypothetical protein WDK95_17705 [Syntrophorhabdaceae bacterium]|jgi:hypothetical protein
MKDENTESSQKDYPFNIKKEDLPVLNTTFNTIEYGTKLLKLTSIKDDYYKYFSYKTNELLNERLDGTGEIKTITIQKEGCDNNRGKC